MVEIFHFSYEKIPVKVTAFSNTEYLFFFNPEVNIATENITEYVIVRGFNIASCSFPVLPLCFFSLSPLMPSP